MDPPIPPKLAGDLLCGIGNITSEESSSEAGGAIAAP